MPVTKSAQNAMREGSKRMDGREVDSRTDATIAVIGGYH
jgi:hypothetical protein